MLRITDHEPAPTTAARDATRPRPEPVGSIEGRRLFLAGAGLVAVVVALVAASAAMPSGPAGRVGAFVLGLAVIPLVASALEWLVHRFVYHAVVLRPLRTIFVVHTAHHYAWFPTWRYTTGGPARRLALRRGARPEVHVSRVRNAGVRLSQFAWYLGIGLVAVWVPAWLLTGDRAFLAGLVAMSVVVSNLFIVVHDTIHRPGSHRLVEAQPWFAFLDRHHYIHHVALGANLNFLLPLADLLFGTLRRDLTPEELTRDGSLAEAKARPTGQGERASASNC